MGPRVQGSGDLNRRGTPHFPMLEQRRPGREVGECADKRT